MTNLEPAALGSRVPRFRHRATRHRPSESGCVVFHHPSGTGGMGKAASFFTSVVHEHVGIRHVITLTTPGTHGDSWQARNTRAIAHALAVLVRTAVVVPDPGVRLVYLPIAQWGAPLARDLTIVALSRLAGKPVVLHLHGAQLPLRLKGRSPLRRLQRALVCNCHWVLLSDQVAELLYDSGIAPRSVHVVRNPVEGNMGTERVKKRGNGLVVGWVGSLIPDKGVDLVSGAVSRLRSEGHAIRLVAAGASFTGPVPPGIDDYLGVLDQTSIGRLWQKVDVFVLPARWVEGQPFVVLEALEAGAAVACTYTPGCDELFANGVLARVDSAEASVTEFLRKCLSGLQEVTRAQQAQWAALRPKYAPEAVAASFRVALSAALRSPEGEAGRYQRLRSKVPILVSGPRCGHEARHKRCS